MESWNEHYKEQLNATKNTNLNSEGSIYDYNNYEAGKHIAYRKHKIILD